MSWARGLRPYVLHFAYKIHSGGTQESSLLNQGIHIISIRMIQSNKKIQVAELE